MVPAQDPTIQECECAEFPCEVWNACSIVEWHMSIWCFHLVSNILMQSNMDACNTIVINYEFSSYTHHSWIISFVDIVVGSFL